MAGTVGKVESKLDDVFRRVKFTTKFHELEFIDCGPGIAVLAPEWEGMALVLTKADVLELKALIDAMVSRP